MTVSRRWTPEEDATLRRQWGRPLDEIDLDRTHRAMDWRARKIGIVEVIPWDPREFTTWRRVIASLESRGYATSGEVAVDAGVKLTAACQQLKRLERQGRVRRAGTDPVPGQGARTQTVWEVRSHD